MISYIYIYGNIKDLGVYYTAKAIMKNCINPRPWW